MAKTMAQIAGGKISNMICCSDRQQETESLKDHAGRTVGIGDTYMDGRWYRDGVEILTPLEETQAKLAAENQDMLDALMLLFGEDTV